MRIRPGLHIPGLVGGAWWCLLVVLLVVVTAQTFYHQQPVHQSETSHHITSLRPWAARDFFCFARESFVMTELIWGQRGEGRVCVCLEGRGLRFPPTFPPFHLRMEFRTVLAWSDSELSPLADLHWLYLIVFMDYTCIETLPDRHCISISISSNLEVFFWFGQKN